MPEFEKLKSLLEKYFPDRLSAAAMQQFEAAFDTYIEWNPRINVISRKDMENLAERHFLHSLAIAKAISFLPGTRVLDAGTGGGFPGIPLAIMFPEVQFHLVDSRGKKMEVVQKIVQSAGLKNVLFSVQRVEEMKTQFDFVVSRAVAPWDKFIPWTQRRIQCRSRHALPNGILYLRGPETGEGITEGKWKAHPLKEYFSEDFFDSKFLVHWTGC